VLIELIDNVIKNDINV